MNFPKHNWKQKALTCCFQAHLYSPRQKVSPFPIRSHSLSSLLLCTACNPLPGSPSYHNRSWRCSPGHKPPLLTFHVAPHLQNRHFLSTAFTWGETYCTFCVAWKWGAGVVISWSRSPTSTEQGHRSEWPLQPPVHVQGVKECCTKAQQRCNSTLSHFLHGEIDQYSYSKVIITTTAMQVKLPQVWFCDSHVYFRSSVQM